MLTSLQSLWLDNSELTGNIPRELGRISGLQALLLHGNRLTGPIPPEIGALAELQYLYLNDNRLTGQIPPQLGELTNLRDLKLTVNAFTGCVPPALRNVQANDAASPRPPRLRAAYPGQLVIPRANGSIGLSRCVTPATMHTSKQAQFLSPSRPP